MANLDVERLEKELQEINLEKEELNDRMRVQGLARGRGGKAWQQTPSDLSRRLEDPSISSRLGPSTAQRPRIASAVVIAHNEDARDARDAPITGTKRAAEVELASEKPELKRRNQRLFGALLGTLKKFKQEEDQIQGSELAKRRAAVLEAAEKRSEEASVQARQQLKELGQKKREEEETRRKELNTSLEIKKMELWCARRISRREKQDNLYVRTFAEPIILWCPKIECPEVSTLLEGQKEATREWKAAKLAELSEKVRDMTGEESKKTDEVPFREDSEMVEERNGNDKEESERIEEECRSEKGGEMQTAPTKGDFIKENAEVEEENGGDQNDSKGGLSGDEPLLGDKIPNEPQKTSLKDVSDVKGQQNGEKNGENETG